MIITALHEKIIQHAREEYPRESCGLVVDGDYIRLDNISEKPMESFAFHKTILLDYAGRVQYVVHSHPDGPECPSAADMEQQIAMDIPGMIVCIYPEKKPDIFTFGEKIRPPLTGRPFRHGVTDCYSLVRDAFALGKIDKIPEIVPYQLWEQPREWGWWEVKGVDLYERNFKPAGFIQLSEDQDLQPWDVLLCSVGSASNTPNHAIVYLGNSLGLHHVGSWFKPYDATRLSVRENIARWRDRVTHRIRPSWLQQAGRVA